MAMLGRTEAEMKLEDMAQRLREANPENKPMLLACMAQIFWPDADWLKKKCRHAGARRGALVAAGLAGRLAQRGLLRRVTEMDAPSMWQWVRPNV